MTISRRHRGAAFAVTLLTVLLVAATAAGASTRRAAMRDLGTLGGVGSHASAINNAGWVVGSAGVVSSDPEHVPSHARAFRWTPRGGMKDLSPYGTNVYAPSWANAINARGQVTGSFSVDPVGRIEDAFRWSASSGMLTIGGPGSGHGTYWAYEGTAINDLGEVAGTVGGSGGPPEAFRWTESGGVQELFDLHSAISEATGINDLGQIVGSAGSIGSAGTHGFRWTPTGGAEDLGTFGGTTSRAVAINERGQVTGSADTTAGASHAFLWTQRRGMQDLGTLGGTNSSAVAINARGQITGNAESVSGESHAFLWTPHRGLRDLGTLGGPDSTATAINARGEVTGYSELRGGEVVHAFRWTPHGGTQDLGTLGGANSKATAINARGQITGDADTASGETHAFLSTPHRSCPHHGGGGSSSLSLNRDSLRRPHGAPNWKLSRRHRRASGSGVLRCATE